MSKSRDISYSSSAMRCEPCHFIDEQEVTYDELVRLFEYDPAQVTRLQEEKYFGYLTWIRNCFTDNRMSKRQLCIKVNEAIKIKLTLHNLIRLNYAHTKLDKTLLVRKYFPKLLGLYYHKLIELDDLIKVYESNSKAADINEMVCRVAAYCSGDYFKNLIKEKVPVEVFNYLFPVKIKSGEDVDSASNNVEFVTVDTTVDSKSITIDEPAANIDIVPAADIKNDNSKCVMKHHADVLISSQEEICPNYDGYLKPYLGTDSAKNNMYSADYYSDSTQEDLNHLKIDQINAPSGDKKITPGREVIYAPSRDQINLRRVVTTDSLVDNENDNVDKLKQSSNEPVIKEDTCNADIKTEPDAKMMVKMLSEEDELILRQNIYINSLLSNADFPVGFCLNHQSLNDSNEILNCEFSPQADKAAEGTNDCTEISTLNITVDVPTDYTGEIYMAENERYFSACIVIDEIYDPPFMFTDHSTNNGSDIDLDVKHDEHVYTKMLDNITTKAIDDTTYIAVNYTADFKSIISADLEPDIKTVYSKADECVSVNTADKTADNKADNINVKSAENLAYNQSVILIENAGVKLPDKADVKADNSADIPANLQAENATNKVVDKYSDFTAVNLPDNSAKKAADNIIVEYAKNIADNLNNKSAVNKVNIQADRQAYADMQVDADMQAYADIQMKADSDMQTDANKQSYADMQTNADMQVYADMQTDMQADMQADIQANTKSDSLVDNLVNMHHVENDNRYEEFKFLSYSYQDIADAEKTAMLTFLAKPEPTDSPPP